MSMMTPSNALPTEPEFLTVDDVLKLHAVLWWRMTSQDCLFLADGKDQRSVHMQRCHCRAPSTCEPYEVDTCPPEMLLPGIVSWVIQSHFSATVRINRCLACGFMKGA